MNEYPKINMDELHVSVRPEEIDSILGLRNTFDYFEVMGNYVSAYLELGWIVKLVIPNLDITLDLDFRQVREVWHQGLTDLAVKGIHACLMVYTGAASNLIVLEVQGKNAEKALILGRDWRAQCVIQAGEEREQHFYTWPPAWKIPTQSVLETLDIQIYGEGGRVTLPPSLMPGAGDPIQWLVPPWESAPSPPPPRLLEFLKGHFPDADPGTEQVPQDIPAWEEIFAHIAANARLMQTLLTPVSNSEDYYRTLLQEARTSGLQDRRLLLGLLWHAPLGTARHDSQSLPWFKDLLQGKAAAPETPQVQEQLADLIKELSRTLADLTKERESTLNDTLKSPYAAPSQPHFNSGNNARQALPGNHSFTVKSDQEGAPTGQSQPFVSPEKPSLFFVQPTIQPTSQPHGEIPVNRKQYEAMIYELGRLGALQKFTSRSVREASSLKSKIEVQRQEEIDHLRQLVREKKNKGWW